MKYLSIAIIYSATIGGHVVLAQRPETSWRGFAILIIGIVMCLMVAGHGQKKGE